jgi:hypothetical protein
MDAFITWKIKGSILGMHGLYGLEVLFITRKILYSLAKYVYYIPYGYFSLHYLHLFLKPILNSFTWF